jgi:hypothetical protein
MLARYGFRTTDFTHHDAALGLCSHLGIIGANQTLEKKNLGCSFELTIIDVRGGEFFVTSDNSSSKRIALDANEP